MSETGPTAEEMGVKPQPETQHAAPEPEKKRGFRALKDKLFGRKTERPERAPLTEDEKKTKDIFFNTFRFGQGNRIGGADLAGDLFLWLKANDYFPPDIPKKPPKYIKDIVTPKQHVKIIRLQSWDQIRQEWKSFYKKSESTITPAEIPDEHIAQRLLSKDIGYQDPQHPRPRPPLPEGKVARPDSAQDQHASFVRRFAIMGAGTGSEPYDDLFRRVRTQLMDAPATSHVGKMREMLSSRWEKNHPGEKFFPEPKPEPDTQKTA